MMTFMLAAKVLGDDKILVSKNYRVGVEALADKYELQMSKVMGDVCVCPIR